MKLLLTTALLLALSPLANASSPSFECKATRGDGDMEPLVVLASVKLDQRSSHGDLSSPDLKMTVDLMEKDRLILQTGSVMVQGHGYLFYADYSADVYIECSATK